MFLLLLHCSTDDDYDKNKKEKRTRILCYTHFSSVFAIHSFILFACSCSSSLTKRICQLDVVESCQMSPRRCAIFWSFFSIMLMYRRRLYFIAFCFFACFNAFKHKIDNAYTSTRYLHAHTRHAHAYHHTNAH